MKAVYSVNTKCRMTWQSILNAIKITQIGTVQKANIEIIPIICVNIGLNYPVTKVPYVLLNIPAEISPQTALTPWREIWLMGSSISKRINIFFTKTKRTVLMAPIIIAEKIETFLQEALILIIPQLKHPSKVNG